MQLRPAQKSISKLRIGLAGPSGSGKTYSALLLASGMTSWEKICVIDTENNSADLYSDLGKYNVITLDAPFTPEKYMMAIKEAETAGMEVIIVDSITHEWTEAKNMVDKLGGRFQDWAKVTPIHDRFVNAIVSSKAHIITTVRSKVDYAMTTEGGKTKVQKVGLKAEAREGFEYELTVSFDLNINHLAEASKDRTGIFMDADPGTISSEHGQKLLKWANTGLDPHELLYQVADLLRTKDTKQTIESICKIYKVTGLEHIAHHDLLAIRHKLSTLPDKPKDEPKTPQAGGGASTNTEAPLTPPPAPNGGDSQIPNGGDLPVPSGTGGGVAQTDEQIVSEETAQAVAQAETQAASEAMASKGDILMFQALMNRHAELTGKDGTDMIFKFLQVVGVESPEQFTKKKIKTINDQLTKQNSEISENNLAKEKSAKELDQVVADFMAGFPKEEQSK